MTYSTESNENTTIAGMKKINTDSQEGIGAKMQPQNKVEVIKALTPIFLALIGGMIGIAVLISKSSDAGFGLASTAIAGAAGLAQPHKDPDRKAE